MASKHIVLVALVLAVLAGAWWIVLGGGGDAEPPAGPGATGAATPGGSVTPPAATSKEAAEKPGEVRVQGLRTPAAKAPGPSVPAGIGQTGKPPKGAAVFPDGTWMPPLNGVTFAGPCPWPDYIPYAPIVEIVTGDKGLQWWKHADGTISNTQMVQRTEGDRTWAEAGWAVGNPAKTLPVDIGGGAKSGAKPPIRIGN